MESLGLIFSLVAHAGYTSEITKAVSVNKELQTDDRIWKILAHFNAQTLLTYAIEANNIQRIQYLLSLDVPIGTALIDATTHNRLDIACLLITNGANLDIHIKYETDDTGDTALIRASRCGHIEMVRLLIEKGADVNMADQFDETALMTACEYHHNEIVRYLLDAGADIHHEGYDGNTALKMAIKHDYKDIVRILVEKGATV